MKTEMKAGVIGAKNSIQIKTVPVPELRDGEALIKVCYCGICGTDVHVLRGEYGADNFPVIPGHEFVGELVEARGVGSELFAPGDMVVAQPFFSCGNCEPCAQGNDNVCRDLHFMGTRVNGGFAEYVKVLTRKMYRLPKGMDLRLAALTEPVAVAVHDVRRSGLKAGQTALVIGGGPIGMLIAMVARHAGARRVVISEISGYRRECAERLGFTTANPLDEGLDGRLMELTDGKGFDVCFEVSGSKPGIASAVRHCTIGGSVMVVGISQDPHPVDLSAVFAKQLRIQGVRIHSQYNFIGAVELLKSGALDKEFLTMVSEEYPLEQIADAFARAQAPGDYFKILVRM